MKIRITFIALIITTCICISSAQDAHPAFRQYTVEDGLAGSEVYQVKQDSRGYIWFATNNGVSRFNGYEFENFSMTNGLPDNTVFEVYEDQEERIWFVPLSCKLSYYYKGKIYLFKYNDALQKLLRTPLKTSFCIDSDGTIYLGVSQDGIYKITKDGKITRNFDVRIEKIGLHVIQPTPSDFVYSNTSSNFFSSIRFDTKTIKGILNLSENTRALRANTRVIKTKSGKILISDAQKLYIISGTDDYKVETFPNIINWLYEDADGDLWLGLYQDGIYYIPGYNFNNKKKYLADISVDGILQDKDGGFWFGTGGNAVYYTPSKELLTFDTEAGFADSHISCLAKDDSNVYAGLKNGLVYKIAPDKTLKSYDYIAKNKQKDGIQCLFYDHQHKQLYVSGNLRTNIISATKGDEQDKIPVFNKMLVDKDKTCWFTCSGGLRKITPDKKGNSLFNNDIKLKRLNAILNDKDEQLLLGAINGLWRFNKLTNTFDYLGKKDSLLQQRIVDIAYGPDSLWIIATKGGGLLMYNNEKKVCQVNFKNGLCSDDVYRVFIDSSTVWVATSKGLNKITITNTSPFKYLIRSYTIADGLPSNEVNDVLKLNDKIWVATAKGLTFFYSGNSTKLPVSTPVYINRILINDRDTLLQNNYELDYDQNNIKIKFTGLGYKNAGKLKYRYRMIGISSDWTYTDNREIQFTTLPAKKYAFELSVLNLNGGWNSNIVRVEFNIHAPFWQKWWFDGIVGIIALLFFVLIYNHRVKKVQMENEKNMELYKVLMNLKLKMLRAQMNPHFTFNVMNSIQHFIISKDEESASRYLSKFSKLIRAILNNSEKNTVPIAEEIKVLELYLELESMRFEQQFKYEIIVDDAIDQNGMEIPSMLIQPYIENAVKHGILPSATRGEIKVELKKENNFLICVIEDNGVGRVKAFQNKTNDDYKSFGTSITQERLTVINELYNSNLSEKITDLYDVNGNATGTRVEIYIPFE